MMNKTLPWPGADSLLRVELTEKTTTVLGEGGESKSSPHSLCALRISTSDGSFQPSLPSPGCSSLPSCFWPPTVFIASSMPEQLGYRGCLLALPTSLAHTVDSDFSSTLENKEGDAGQNNSNFGWFREPKRLHRQLSLAAAGDGFHTRSAKLR